jgi:hypothetical protein
MGKKDQVPILVIEPCNDNENEREVPKQLMSQITPGIINRLNRFGFAAPAILIEEMN